jgi:hypothetical protein
VNHLNDLKYWTKVEAGNIDKRTSLLITAEKKVLLYMALMIENVELEWKKATTTNTLA